MSSKSTCTYKTLFFSETVAQNRADELNFYANKKFSVYHCRYCKAYHLTTHPKKVNNIK